MTYDEALAFFKSGRRIAEVIGVSPGRVSQYRSAGGFSYPIQCVLEKESGRKLVARRKDAPATTDAA